LSAGLVRHPQLNRAKPAGPHDLDHERRFLQPCFLG
jgi:hypothetical protein